MNRKATFAKRQRETDLKDHARAKEARKAARLNNPKTSKGPEIAWDEAVTATTEDPVADAPTTTPITATASDPVPPGR
jgi:hypothetical protein